MNAPTHQGGNNLKQAYEDMTNDFQSILEEYRQALERLDLAEERAARCENLQQINSSLKSQASCLEEANQELLDKNEHLDDELQIICEHCDEVERNLDKVREENTSLSRCKQVLTEELEEAKEEILEARCLSRNVEETVEQARTEERAKLCIDRAESLRLEKHIQSLQEQEEGMHSEICRLRSQLNLPNMGRDGSSRPLELSTTSSKDKNEKMWASLKSYCTILDDDDDCEECVSYVEDKSRASSVGNTTTGLLTSLFADRGSAFTRSASCNAASFRSLTGALNAFERQGRKEQSTRKPSEKLDHALAKGISTVDPLAKKSYPSLGHLLPQETSDRVPTAPGVNDEIRKSRRMIDQIRKSPQENFRPHRSSPLRAALR
jgi:myosin heavy subunit